MKKRVLTLATLIGVFITVSLIAPHVATAQQATPSKKDPRSFKKASKSDDRIKKDMLKSREYKQVYSGIKSKGAKGPAAARQRLRVYPKEAIATEVTVIERTRQNPNPVPRLVQIGVVFVDSGGDLGAQSTPVGIVMVGTDRGKYKPLTLMAGIGKDGEPTSSLVDAKGKSIFDSPISVLDKPLLRVKPNGTAVSMDNEGNVLIVMSRKRTGKTLALVVPSEVWIQIIGRYGVSAQQN